MAQRPVVSRPKDETTRVLDGGFWLVVGMAVVLGVLVLAMVARGLLAPGSASPGSSGATAASAEPSASVAAIDPASFLYTTPIAAPPIELTDPEDRHFSLTSLRGQPVFVFFGYTHCPDVCPVTIGTVGLTMDAFAQDVGAVFVSVDPERDTTTWLKEFIRFMPTGFVALTGTSSEIRNTADAWNARYARVETGSAEAYSMAHTAEVYLVDANGMLRAEFPFGTETETMTAVLREVVASPLAMPPISPAASSEAVASPGASGAATATVEVEVISTSVWAGEPAPIILRLSTDGSPLNDRSLHPIVQLVGSSGEVVGNAAVATPVPQPGVETLSYVVSLTIPTAGDWTIDVSAARPGATLAGSTALTVLDPGETTPIGDPAPRVRTPTLADVGGDIRAVTTDPAPDLRLSQRSTVDALDDGQPFVLVIDSSKFRTSPACGRAILLARYLADRWRDVGFIHVEPYPYSVVASTPVLDSTLDNPSVNEASAAWGFTAAPWGARSMPWVFVVDGDGVVRAKYQDIMGSNDVDVILALIEQSR